MRVGGPGRPTAASGGKNKNVSAKSGEKFSLAEDATEAANSAGVSTASPIGSVDALVALQGVDDATEGNRKAMEKGEDLLEKLEEIRDGLLIGTISADRLLKLKETLASYNLSGADPKLAEIVRDIEVRAAVELAKFGY